MSATRFTKDHEWIRNDGDDTATVGITDYAQEQLGDVVFVELPDLEKRLKRGEDAAVIESVKAAGELKAPASGTVTAINQALSDDPALVNRAAEGDGWFLKLSLDDAGELDSLMDEETYKQYLSDLE